MTTSEKRASYEQALAIAHKWLYVAGERAERVGDEGAELDCIGLMREVTRLSEDSLKGRGRKLSFPEQPLSVVPCVSQISQSARRASGAYER